MQLQNRQLQNMSKWLSAMEDVINSAQPIGTDPDVVKKQTSEHEVICIICYFFKNYFFFSGISKENRRETKNGQQFGQYGRRRRRNSTGRRRISKIGNVVERYRQKVPIIFF